MTRSQHICNCKYTCQRVLCLLTWRHQQRVASHCLGKLWLWGQFSGPISTVHGSFGEHLGRPKIAHGSPNDVRRLCWPNFRDIHGLQLVVMIYFRLDTCPGHSLYGPGPPTQYKLACISARVVFHGSNRWYLDLSKCPALDFFAGWGRGGGS